MEDDDFWDMEFGGDGKQKKRMRRAPAPAREKAPSGGRRGIDRESIIAKYKIMQVRVQDRNGNYFMVKKKVRYATVYPVSLIAIHHLYSHTFLAALLTLVYLHM
jgi:hypothetical protein